eukprot:Gregarina_sp_Pseudo_9__814@NODE_1520_length_1527_cov_33_926075_g1408_i0_p1_GENE_NODE_1520_length_1527_cov_33_926075_g1408_i0NODE_1520_length_1527_cov_33_926075_g1408_i0_p1_ORF_typecomplete_len396_score67_10DNA_pol_E_B/PF04042_16/2_7e27DNA_pol_D_N/PF18018_1/2_9e22DNA_pol_D_N/PF18018_1/7_5e03_NODE_1520_length_1527_cov_33_926075_g1408_i02771464
MDTEAVPSSLLDGEAFGQQYAGVYFSRLVLLRKYVNQAMVEKWGSEALEILPRIGAVSEQECMVVGTICKGAKVSSEEVRQYLTELNLDVDLKDWRQPADIVILEDESARLTLVPANDKFSGNKLVTGMVVGIKGHMSSSGDLVVDDFTFPASLRAPSLPSPLSDKVVVFVSGVQIGRLETRLTRLMRVRDFLSSLEGSLAHIVLVGDTIAMPETFDSMALLDEADTFLASLASFCEVTVMPGPLDPTLGALPQPPIHGALLPRADMFDTFHAVSNPHKFEIQGIKFLGTSGQPIRNIMTNTDYASESEALEATLKSRCVAPTAPDSVMCHSKPPGSLLIESADPPHVLFAGGCDNFSCKSVDGFTLLTIPRFWSASELVVLHLDSLKARAVSVD